MSVNPTILGPGAYQAPAGSTITDSSGDVETLEEPATVTVPEPTPPPPPPDTPMTVTGSPPNGTVGDSYSTTFGVSGGTPDYTWAITGLPPGVTADEGAISGTPTTAGSYSIGVGVTDADGETASAEFPVTIAAAPTQTAPKLAFFLSSESPSAEQGACPVPMQLAPYYAGGSAWNSFTAPSLPSGLGMMLSVGQLTAAQAQAIGSSLLSAGHPDAFIRVMWEFNDSSFPWKSLSASAYIAAFQGIYSELKAISPTFTIGWCPNGTSTIPTGYYPGDNYCDSIGADQYDFGGYAANTKAMIAFAAEHGKPAHLGEWGLNGSDDPTFITTMAGLILAPASNFVAHCYFSWKGSINSLLSDFPNSQAAFKTAFAG